jgi:hypothetical protein
MSSGTIGGFTIGGNYFTSNNFGLYSGATSMLLLGHATDYNTAKIGFKNDGAGKVASGNFYWDASGNITASTLTLTNSTANGINVIEGEVKSSATMTVARGKGGVETGYWLGEFAPDDYKLFVGSSTSYLGWETGALSIVGGTITGGTFQTAASGQIVVIDGATNKIIFYDPAGSVGTLYGSGGNIVSNASWSVNSTSIVGLYAGTTGSGGIGLEGEGGGNPAIGVSGKALGAGINRAIYGDAQNGTANYAGYFNNGKVYIKNALEVGSERLIINSSGQLTKVDNTAASGNIGYVLASDGTSFTPTSGYATQSWVEDQDYSTFDGAYSSLSGIPSTFAPSSHKHLLGDLWDGSYYVTTAVIDGYTVLVLDD